VARAVYHCKEGFVRNLNVFNFLSIDGYYKDVRNGIDWHEHGGDDEMRFSSTNANSGATLLFGRITYEMMQQFWTSELAKVSMPAVADGMNKAEKIVFSRTLDSVSWAGTKLIKEDLCASVRALKNESGPGITILGSGSIVAQLADEGLIDTYQFLVVPVALGAGTPLFKGIKSKVRLRLTDTKVFESGKVLLNYSLQR